MAQPAKTPKTGTKLKLSTPKTPATEPSTKKKTVKPKAKPVPKPTASDDEVVDTPKVEQAPLTPQAAKEIKEKKGEIDESCPLHIADFPSALLST